MRVLCISGSQVKKGNTTQLIDILIDNIESSNIPDLKIKKMSLSGLTLRPCKACEKCKKTGKCVIRDDFNKVIRRMHKSDLIIIGSPVYFHDVSGLVKNFIDRTFSLWHEKQLQGKKFIPIAVSAESGEDRTLETLRIWAQVHEMKIVSSLSGHGQKPGDVNHDQKALAAVRDVIQDIIGEVKSTGS